MLFDREPVELINGGGKMTPEERIEHTKRIMREALDDALRDHVKHVFEIWMKDSTDQPRRARQGVKNAVAAHRGAHEAIDRWDGKTDILKEVPR